MAFQSGVGTSHNRNPRVAGQEAARRALDAAGTAKPDFVLLFASIGYAQQALVAAVRDATGRAPLCGCSGEGIIAQGEADESAFSVSVMVFRSDEVTFRAARATGVKASSLAAGAALGEQLRPYLREDTRAGLLFGDGLTLNFDDLLIGIEERLGRHLPLYGGVSADNWAFKQTYQYFDDEVFSDGALCVLLSGDIQIASAANHGCVPFGSRMTVTRSEKNRIYEIDGRPVLDVLKEYLVEEEIDSWDKAVINLCLGFRAPGFMREGYDEYLIRFIPAKDEETRSITMQTEIPQGCDIWMTRRDPEQMEAGLERIRQDLQQQLGGRKPKAILHVECCGRGKVILREHQKARFLKTLQDGLGKDVPWMGFYSLGEIWPVGGKTCFHNYTAVLMVLH